MSQEILDDPGDKLPDVSWFLQISPTVFEPESMIPNFSVQKIRTYRKNYIVS